MALRYRVGGTGTWDASTTTGWSATSGGAGGASVPTNQDDVVFDSNSSTANASYTCTIGAAVCCKSITIGNPGGSGVLTLAGSSTLGIHDSLTVSSATGITNSYTGAITFNGAKNSHTINTNGLAFGSAIAFSSNRGWYTLQAAISTTGGITNSGTILITGGFSVTASGYSTTATAPYPQLQAGSSTITLSGSFQDLATTAVTLLSSATVVLTGATSAFACATNAQLGTLNYASTALRTSGGIGTGLTAAQQATNTQSIGNLTFTPSTIGQNVAFISQAVTVTSTLTTNGGAQNKRTLLMGYTLATTTFAGYGVNRTITAAAVSLTNTDFSSITAAGAAGTWTGTSLGNAGGNSNITFTSAATLYAVATGNVSAFATWSLTSGGGAASQMPLPQDTVNLNAASSTAVVTMDVALLGAINCTGFAGTFTTSVASHIFIGSQTFNSTMTLTFGNGTYTYGPQTGTLGITSGGAAPTMQAMAINAPGATVKILDTFNIQSNSGTAISFVAGTLDFNGQSVTARGLSITDLASPQSTAKVWTLGAAQANFAFIGGSFTNASTSVNLTITPGTSTIFLPTNNGTITLGTGFTYYNFNIAGEAAGQAVQPVSGSATFNNLTLDADGEGISAISFNGNQTVNGTFKVTGSMSVGVNRVAVISATPGTPVTITAAAVALDHADFCDITAAGASGTWTGTSIGNAGGNTNITPTTPTTLYVVSSGNFNNPNVWALTSGGSPLASQMPLPQDTIVLDTGGTGTVAFWNSGFGSYFWPAVSCLAGTASSITNTNSSGIGVVVGSQTYVSGAAITPPATFGPRGSITLTPAGNAMNTNGMTINAPGGTVTLAGDMASGSPSAITLTNGSFNSAGHAVYATGLTCTDSVNTKALTLGASTVHLSGTGASAPWNVTSTNLTASLASSTLSWTNAASATTALFAGGGYSYGTVTLADTGSNAASWTITGADTFVNFTLGNGNAIQSAPSTIGSNITVSGTFTCTGNSANIASRYWLASGNLGTPITITAAAVSLSNTDFMDIHSAGAAAPFTGTSLGDCQGNSGITMTAAKTNYAAGGGAMIWQQTMWAATSGGTPSSSISPLPQDTCNIDANSGGGTVALMANGRQCANMNFTGYTGSVSFTAGSIFGNVTLASSMTVGSAAAFPTLCGRGAQTLTSAGVFNANQFAAGIFLQAPGGTYTMQDASIWNQVSVREGTLNTNGMSLTSSNLGVSNAINNSTAANGLTLGASVITITGSSAVAFQVAGTSTTISAGTSNLKGTAAVFGLSINQAVTLNNIEYAPTAFTAAGNPTVKIINTTTGNITVNTITIDSPGCILGLPFGAETTTVSALSINGTSALNNIMQPSTVSMSNTSSLICAANLNLSDVTVCNNAVSGGAIYDALISNSNVDGWGNSGWLFVFSSLTGVSCTGTVAAVTASDGVTLVGVHCIGTVAAVTPSPSTTLSGVHATGAVGSLVAQVSKTLTGVAATGTVAALPANPEGIITGVSGTGKVAGVESLAMTGVACTGVVAALVPNISLTLTSVTATGTVAQVTAEPEGILSPVTCTGVVAAVSHIDAFQITGVACNGNVAAVVANPEGIIISVTALGVVAPVTVADGKSITGVACVGAVGGEIAQVGPIITGVQAIGSVGSVSLDDFINLVGVAATGRVAPIVANPEGIIVGVSGYGVVPSTISFLETLRNSPRLQGNTAPIRLKGAING